MTNLNLLWHMHQPDYRLPGSGEALLPWVRLHAARGYNDLAAMLERWPSLRCTVNFSGILLEQLTQYDPAVRDVYARLSTHPVQDLSLTDRSFVVTNFFSANHATLITHHARYRGLYELREGAGGRQAEDAHEAFTDDDLRDLIVWFNLAWIGFDGQRLPVVKQLLETGSGFTFAQQLAVLSVHDELVARVLPRYRALARAGTVELSFTPYAHPILPLLCDLNGMGHTNTADPLPELRAAGDAAEHIRRGAVLYRQCFGAEAAGAWPAEGSVSNAALTLCNLLHQERSRFRNRVVRCLTAAVSVGMTGDTPVLDLNYIEDRDAAVDANIVGLSLGGFAEVQATSEHGFFNRQQLDSMLDLASPALDALYDMQRSQIRLDLERP